jgi:hypothetical protein
MTIQNMPGDPVSHESETLAPVTDIDPHQLIQADALKISFAGVRYD